VNCRGWSTGKMYQMQSLDYTETRLQANLKCRQNEEQVTKKDATADPVNAALITRLMSQAQSSSVHQLHHKDPSTAAAVRKQFVYFNVLRIK